MTQRHDRVTAWGARLQPQRLRQDLDRQGDRLTRLTQRLALVGHNQLTRWQDRLIAVDRQREILSYKATLARGYAVVRAEGAVVTTRAQAAGSTEFEIEFADGRLDVGGAEVGSASADPAPAPRSASRTKSQSPPDDQGSLF